MSIPALWNATSAATTVTASFRQTFPRTGSRFRLYDGPPGHCTALPGHIRIMAMTFSSLLHPAVYLYTLTTVEVLHFLTLDRLAPGSRLGACPLHCHLSRPHTRTWLPCRIWDIAHRLPAARWVRWNRRSHWRSLERAGTKHWDILTVVLHTLPQTTLRAD